MVKRKKGNVDKSNGASGYSYILGRRTKTKRRWSIFPSQRPANLEACGGNEEGWQIKAAGVRFRAAVNI